MGGYDRCNDFELNVMREKHGLYKTPEYNIWSHIKDRCLNPHNQAYSDYGGRGISVCERWKNSFKAFYQDMGDRPSDKHTLDRVNNNGGYEPGNCRWTSKTNQCINQRIQKRNTSGFKGITWYKSGKKWQSYIRVNKEKVHLGYFADIEKAVEARDYYIILNELFEYPLQSEYYKALYPD